ncbi:hypothetical protein KEJ25_09480 [Candidatus Bathyarchaeota archaeon]|nr:hypothetical protein [Candidatus Bathyarchaeota archaeon]
MRLVKKVSRKKYFSKSVYEYERIYLPIPAKYTELFKSLLGRDLEVEVKPENGGVVVRVRPLT